MLGDRIHELRTAHALSQTEFAKKLNVSKQSVSNWENGNIQPSIDMLLKIAQLFSVSTDYLLGLESVRRLDIDGLTTGQLAFVQQMIDYLKKGNCAH